jgi:MFS family permease
MLKKEILKTEEEEVANTQERLFDSSENKNQENDDNIVDEELNTKELSKENDESDTSEKIVEEKNKEEQANESNPPNNDLNGSTVEIVQPADLKPKHLGFTRNLLLAMFAAMIGTGAQFGYALGVMNAPSQLIKNYTKALYLKRYNVTISDYSQDILYSTAISVVALGGVLGGLLSIPLSDRYGRKIGLLLNNIPAIIGSVLMVISKNIASFEAFIVGRILIGFTAGFGATVGPIYINEIAPIRVRGSFGACFQLFVAFAVLLAEILGLDIILGRPNLWNYLFAVPIIFSILQCTLLIFTHETPKFLLQRKRQRAAARALKWFRCETDLEVVRAEIHEMEADFHNLETNTTRIAIRDLWAKPLLRKCLLILAITHIAQHFTASFVIFFFGNLILFRANLRIEYAPYAMLSCGITYLAVAISLVFILDKVGRRSLILYGLIGMAAASCVIGVTILKSRNIPLFHMIFLEIFAMMTHVGFSAMGPGR